MYDWTGQIQDAGAILCKSPSADLGVGSAVLLGVLGHVSYKYHPGGAHAEGPWPCNVVASVKYVKRKASECCGP